MSNLKKISLFACCCLIFNLSAQETDTLELDLPTAEKLLLENNLSLLAERLNIDKAEAHKIQAKVWPNPTLSVDEVNLFSTPYQRRHGDKMPPLFGSESFGEFRQISAQIEQMVETAGKRGKRMAIAEVSSEKAAAYLADFLLGLKTEFRKNIFDYRYHYGYINMLKKQLNSLKNIVKAYQTQYDKGNVNKGELIRLRSSELKIKDELIEEENALNELQSNLIVLLNLPDDTPLSFHSVFKSDYDYQLSFNYTLPYLQEQALKHRPDVLLSKLETKLADKELTYEKSLAVPDVALSVGYDRGGGIYPDFVGVGFSVDLPFFDRNKGNIKKAEINVQQQNYHREKHVLAVKSDVRKKYKNLIQIGSFFENVDADYVDDLDRSMEAYTEYFRLQNINILTFMDFLEAYIDNKQTILENQREYLDAVEDLKYATGIEINN